MLSFKSDEVVMNAFTDSVLSYFDETIDTEYDLGTPYLLKNEDIMNDYIGIIGISGNRVGYVIISSNRDALGYMVRKVFEEEPDEELVQDMAGELVNTISGNVREFFGDEFLISTPIVLSGKFETIRFPKDIPIFSIPIQFEGHVMNLIIGIK